MSGEARTIKQLVKDAGGADVVAKAATDRGMSLTKWAVYKWDANGIPEKYWAVVVDLAGSDPREIYEANEPTRIQAA